MKCYSSSKENRQESSLRVQENSEFILEAKIVSKFPVTPKDLDPAYPAVSVKSKCCSFNI